MLPKTRIERVRAAIYLASIALQAGAAVSLVWSFRRPVHVAMWPGVQVSVPFFPVILYLLYRVLRYAFLNYRSLMETAGLRSAEAAG